MNKVWGRASSFINEEEAVILRILQHFRREERKLVYWFVTKCLHADYVCLCLLGGLFGTTAAVLSSFIWFPR